MLCPYFESEETLIASFIESWPHHIDNLNPQRMAKAGFLYRGSDDRTICFYCGLCLYQCAKTNIPEIEHMRYWSGCGYLERTFQIEFITQHSNFHTQEDEYLSGTRFGFATPGEAANPTLVRNPPVEKEQTNLKIPEAKQCDKELVCKVCFEARINTLAMPSEHCFICLTCTAKLSAIEYPIYRVLICKVD